jgi:uncharacterized protein YqeY
MVEGWWLTASAPHRNAYNSSPSAYGIRMALSEAQLTADLTAYEGARHAARLRAPGVITAAKNLMVERRTATLNEADLVQIIRREIRQREEAEEFASKAGRADAVEQNRAERKMLDAYVPAQLDAAALETVVRGIVALLPSPAMGP